LGPPLGAGRSRDAQQRLCSRARREAARHALRADHTHSHTVTQRSCSPAARNSQPATLRHRQLAAERPINRLIDQTPSFSSLSDEPSPRGGAKPLICPPQTGSPRVREHVETNPIQLHLAHSKQRAQSDPIDQKSKLISNKSKFIWPNRSGPETEGNQISALLMGPASWPKW